MYEATTLPGKVNAMKRVVSRRALIGLTACLAVLAVAGLVFAAWLTSGSGSGYAKAGSSQALSTVDASASTSATLYPGVTGDVTITVSNPNPFPVRVTSVSLNGTNADIAPDSGHASCSPTGVSFTNQTGLSIDVPAQSGGTNGTATATLTGAASMSNASANGCQGATFTIPVNLSGASNAG
jgi:hypothetical protein